MGPALLANVAADLTVAGVDVPSRRVFCHGRPVYDGECGLLAVWIQRVDIGTGGSTIPRAQQGPGGLPATHVVTWGIELGLCAAERSAVPTVADVNADGAVGAVAHWSLMRSLTTRWKHSTLFAPYVTLVDGKGANTAAGDTPDVLGGILSVRAQLSVFTQDVIL